MPVGATWTTAGRTVTEADVVAFAGISGDFNPIHTDHAFAATTDFGGPIAHGLLVLSMVTGLRMQSGLLTGTVIAFLGIDTWRFTAPVRFGDTIRAEIEVIEARASQKPDRGLVRQRIRVLNQRDELVQEGVFVTMMKRRPV